MPPFPYYPSMMAVPGDVSTDPQFVEEEDVQEEFEAETGEAEFETEAGETEAESTLPTPRPAYFETVELKGTEREWADVFSQIRRNVDLVRESVAPSESPYFEAWANVVAEVMAGLEAAKKGVFDTQFWSQAFCIPAPCTTQSASVTGWIPALYYKDRFGGLMPGVVSAARVEKTHVLDATVTCVPTCIENLTAMGFRMMFVFQKEWYEFAFGCGLASETTPQLWYEIISLQE
jgi:hypothetical protein